VEKRAAALPRAEVPGIVALAGAMLLLRAAYCFSYPFDSDEPQHLHVAWAWTQGLLPYRDVFDNHAPLFHVLSAPLVALIGESPRILVFMRLALIPLSAATLWGTYLLGRRLFGARAGWWAAILCGLSPTFFFKSVEYRTDVLWAALWVLAIAVFLSGPAGPRRWLFGGLLLGACLAVSLKTVMLLAALGIAAAGVLLLGARPARMVRSALAAAGGMVVVPAAIVAWFGARGALTDLYYCVIGHNLLPGVGRWGYSKRLYLLLPILALLLGMARLLVRRVPGPGVVLAFLLLLSGSQYLLLSTVWPVHTRQDLLPFYPLFTVLLAGGMLAWRGGGVRLAAGLACLQLLVLPALSPLRGQGTRVQERLLAEVLRLTDPSDPVLDLKGQSVFRNRPFYFALETMTLERMARGLIADRIPERCVETRTCVAPADIKGFPPRARRFLEEHFVVVGSWRVAGVVLEPAAGDADRALSFEIAIPARYAVAGREGPPRGMLDGAPCDGPRDLAPGRHEYRPAPADGPIAIIWAQAVERGFTPFAKRGDSL
jgi:hypothetical protein